MTSTVHKYYNSTKYTCTTVHTWVLPKHAIINSALTISSTAYHNEGISYTMELWMLLTTGQKMSLYITLTTECLTAYITAIGTLPSMYTLMYLQMLHLLECCITLITGIWTLPSMYMLMYFQILHLVECCITLITAIWTLPSMYTLMYRQVSFLNECFIT